MYERCCILYNRTWAKDDLVTFDSSITNASVSVNHRCRMSQMCHICFKAAKVEKYA